MSHKIPQDIKMLNFDWTMPSLCDWVWAYVHVLICRNVFKISNVPIRRTYYTSQMTELRKYSLTKYNDSSLPFKSSVGISKQYLFFYLKISIVVDQQRWFIHKHDYYNRKREGLAHAVHYLHLPKIVQKNIPQSLSRPRDDCRSHSNLSTTSK